MIADMASLKQAMEQMDAEDATVAQTGKDRAAQILSDAGMSFARLAEMVEQHRLLLRPKIVASIKRMDQPAMLGDAAFRDATASLRKEGQSFRQIADALDMRSSGAVSQPAALPSRLNLTGFHDDFDGPESPPGMSLALRFALYPFRHPVQVFAIAVLSFMLVNQLREFAAGGRPVASQSASDNVARQHADASPSPTPSPSSTTPSASSPGQPSAASPTTPADTSASATAKAAPSATEPAPTAPASPSAVIPPASKARQRSLSDFMPERLRRKSRLAGQCRGGMGGCYWGGYQY